MLDVAESGRNVGLKTENAELWNGVCIIHFAIGSLGFELFAMFAVEKKWKYQQMDTATQIMSLNKSLVNVDDNDIHE